MKKLICKFFGHKWNTYSLRSSYRFKVCKRCGFEELKEGKKDTPISVH